MRHFGFSDFNIHLALRNHSSRLVGKRVWCYDKQSAKLSSAQFLPFDLYIDEKHVQLQIGSLILGSVYIFSFRYVRNGQNHTYADGCVYRDSGVRRHRENLPMGAEDLTLRYASANVLREVLLHSTLRFLVCSLLTVPKMAPISTRSGAG